jgi:hypothetical protein
MNFQVPVYTGKSLSSFSIGGFSRRAQLNEWVSDEWVMNEGALRASVPMLVLLLPHFLVSKPEEYSAFLSKKNVQD